MKLDDLEKEIEEMEKSVFGDPSEQKQEEATEEEGAEEVEEESTEVPDERSDTETHEEVPEETTDQVESESKKKAREDWKKRFTKYKAATDATIHQLRVDLAGALEQNSGMYKRVQDLVEEVRSLKELSYSKEDIFSDEEKDILGDDAINAIKKANASLVERQVKPLQEELKRREAETLKERELRAASEKERAFADFKARLSAHVKDLDEINLDPKFAEWLNTIEPGSGMQRMILFRRAENSQDVVRIAGFFNDYAAKRDSHKNILKNKVTPTGSSVANSTHVGKDTTNNKIWTTSQIDKFMDDQIRGLFKGRETQEKEISAEIDLAISQGRVRKG